MVIWRRKLVDEGKVGMSTSRETDQENNLQGCDIESLKRMDEVSQ